MMQLMKTLLEKDFITQILNLSIDFNATHQFSFTFDVSEN